MRWLAYRQTIFWARLLGPCARQSVTLAHWRSLRLFSARGSADSFGGRPVGPAWLHPLPSEPAKACVHEGSNSGAKDRGCHIEPCIIEISSRHHRAKSAHGIERGPVSAPPMRMLKVTVIPMASGARLPARPPPRC